MILNHEEILSIINAGVLENADPENVNGTSYDLRLGRYILVETLPEQTRNTGISRVVSLKQKDSLTMTKIDLEKEGHFILRPGQFILAETLEKFHLPLHISAEYKLKSSMARIGLEHLNAGWCDPGWHGSVLTLEFRNMTTFHEIELLPGDKIGQVIFYNHKPVLHSASYAARGRYNNLDSVSAPIKTGKD